MRKIRLDLGEIKFSNNQEISEGEAQEYANMQAKLAKVHNFKEV